MRYRFGEFVLDVAERQLVRDGEAVYLRPRPFAMLRYLVERPRHLVEKRELLDALWPGTIVSESAVTQSIKEVRRALHDDAHHPQYIETIARVGYRFRSRVEQIWGGDGRALSAAVQEAYVKGRYFLEKRTEAGFRAAEALFVEAARQAPDFAPAYVGLADCYNLLCNYDLASPRELAPRAKEAAQQAIELEPRRSDAHAALGFAQMYYDWDGDKALGSFQHAIEIDATNVDAHHWLGLCHMMRGQFDDALREMQTAKSLDPLSLIVLTNIGWVHYFARQFEVAARAMQEAIDMDPHFPAARVKLAWCLEQMGSSEEAIAALEEVARTETDSATIDLHLAEALALGGEYAASQERLTRILARRDDNYISPYWVATAFLGLDEHEEALRWLRAAHEEQSGWLPLAPIEPKLDPLRDTPGFRELLRLGRRRA